MMPQYDQCAFVPDPNVSSDQDDSRETKVQEHLDDMIAKLWLLPKVRKQHADNAAEPAVPSDSDEASDEDGDEDGDVDEDDDDVPIVEDVTDSLSKQRLAQTTKPRLECGERVLCRLPNGWFLGKVIDLDPRDEAVSGLGVIHVRLESASVGGHRTVYMQDKCSLVRPEVCFGQRADAESFTRACLVQQCRSTHTFRRHYWE